MAPPFLYTTLAVGKLNGRGLSNTTRHERLPKKTAKVTYGTSYRRTTMLRQQVRALQL